MILCNTFFEIKSATMIQIMIITDFLPNIAKIFVCFDEKCAGFYPFSTRSLMCTIKKSTFSHADRKICIEKPVHIRYNTDKLTMTVLKGV